MLLDECKPLMLGRKDVELHEGDTLTISCMLTEDLIKAGYNASSLFFLYKGKNKIPQSKYQYLNQSTIMYTKPMITRSEHQQYYKCVHKPGERSMSMKLEKFCFIEVYGMSFVKLAN